LGRKRIYKDNATKLREWRKQKKIEKAQAFAKFIDLSKEQEQLKQGKPLEVIEREKDLENASKFLVEQNKLQCPGKEVDTEDIELDLMTEDQFEEYIKDKKDNNKGINNAWTCSTCDTQMLIYKERCTFCGQLRPSDLDEEAELFLCKYPIARKWVQVKETFLEMNKRFLEEHPEYKS
jgi:hypothetical protein